MYIRAYIYQHAQLRTTRTTTSPHAMTLRPSGEGLGCVAYQNKPFPPTDTAHVHWQKCPVMPLSSGSGSTEYGICGPLPFGGGGGG